MNSLEAIEHAEYQAYYWKQVAMELLFYLKHNNLVTKDRDGWYWNSNGDSICVEDV